MNELRPGDWVTIAGVGKVGVIESIGGKNAKVRVGEVSFNCKTTNLSPASAPPPKPKSVYAEKIPEPSLPRKDLERLDLHGLRVDEAISALEYRIDQAALAGLDRIEVLHGIGSGRIRDALFRHLPTLKVVKSFRPDDSNPGVTWIYL